MADWPFAEPGTAYVFTTKRVLYRRLPILLAMHNEDGSWHFFEYEDFEDAGTGADNGAIVTFSALVQSDGTLLELADLPPGWQAQREARGEPWHRKEMKKHRLPSG
jgi:hypothetical protein